MRLAAWSLGSITLALLVALGIAVSAALPACDTELLGTHCTIDSQCTPLVCSAPVPPAGTAPLPGTCQLPAGKGGLCYRDANCEGGLVCSFPDGDAPYAEGDCEPPSDVDYGGAPTP